MPPRPRRKGVVVLAAAALAGAVALRLTAGFGLVTHTAPSLAAVGPRALLRSANLVARAADELEAKMVLVQELKWQIEPSCEDETMRYRVVARYAPSNGSSSLSPLWVSSEELSALCDGDSGESLSSRSVVNGSLTLVRLRPSCSYDVEVLVYAGGASSAEWRGSFVSASTGWVAFDAGANGANASSGTVPSGFVQLEGSAPSWEMVTFAVQEDNLGFDDPPAWANASNSKQFDGVVAVDAEGFVVWYYHLDGFEAWDFVPGGNMVMLAREQGGHEVTAQLSQDARGRIWRSNSQLQEVTALGELKAQYVGTCTGSPLHYNQLSHECRVDRATVRASGGGSYEASSSGNDDDDDDDDDESASGSLDVLSARFVVRRYANVTLRSSADDDTVSSGFVSSRTDLFAGTEIVRWKRDSNELEVLYNLFDLASPPDVSLATSNWNTVSGDARCSGDSNATVEEAIEYHHVSSVSVGVEQNILVASRNLNTVWSLAHDGSGVQWTLSSSLNQGDEGVHEGGLFYTFQHDMDKFYNPHSALQLPNGDLLIVDDGDDRPGCGTGTSRQGGCFSRAICYTLDAATQRATVRWQFEWPFELDVVINDTPPPPPPTTTTSTTTTTATATTTPDLRDDVFERSTRRRGRLLDETPSTHWEVAERDLFNDVGGSVALLPNGNYLVAFTSIDKDNLLDKRGTAFAFEIDPLQGAATAQSKLAIPTPKTQQYSQAAYRLVPWNSINGESSTPPRLNKNAR